MGKRPRQRRKDSTAVKAPVLKLRHLVVGVLVVASAVAGPLLAVRKQVYLRDLAIRREQLADSLHTALRQAAALTVQARSLASSQRIESIARGKLGMDYPKPQQIVIVGLHPIEGRRRRGGFLALLRRSLGRDKG